ncbi:MAG: adenosine kinase [Candidatus Hydrogenedens sp.]|jgi:sugar/nucleoside kinase (ribokinase family)|nr:adenosine kinase [Candidatus Hydrogenedens sp.]
MAMTDHSRILGVGSPLMDILAPVPESFLEGISGAKGGMQWLEPEEMAALIPQLPEEPHRAPGGSAANTVCVLAQLGWPVALLGKMGRDADGEAYKKAFVALGGVEDSFKYDATRHTGRCLSLITPDGERTMRTDLGAAMFMEKEDLLPEDFEPCNHVHIEGYGLFNRDYFHFLLKSAKEAGCTVSIDMASFEVVRDSLDILPELLTDYVDMVFANEEEAEAFSGNADPEAGLKALAACSPVVAVKLGAEGALLHAQGEQCRVDAVPVAQLVDTTGAGDCWAAGFLHGYLKGWPLENCGRFASLVGAETVRCLGASPGAEGWERIRALESELNKQ